MLDHLNKELLIRIAWQYFYEDRSQQEIGDDLGLPRIKVARLLKTIRERRIVDIRIGDEYLSLCEAERRFAETTGLGRTTIVPSGRSAAENVAIGAAERFRSLCSSHRSIGIGASRIVADALNRIDAPIPRAKLRTLVSLTGNAMPNYAANPASKGWELSKVLGADFYFIWAPAVAASAAQAAELRSNPVVEPALRIADSVDLAFVGLGDIRNSLMFAHGFLKKGEVDAICARGAVGELFGHFYDADGSLLSTGIEDRVIGVAFPMRCPVHAVAYGSAKAMPIVGAIKGGLIDGLVTDEATADAVLRLGWGVRGKAP